MSDEAPSDQAGRRTEEEPVPDPATVVEDSRSDSQVDKPAGTTDTWYTVDNILGVKHVAGTRLYRVKWTGFSDTTWEPEANLTPELVRQYHATHTLQGRRRKHSGPKYFHRS
ncbi:MAG: chromo domain-containing protein [Sedimenticola sp.]